MGQQNQILDKNKDGDIPVQSAIRSKAPKEIIELFFIIAKELNLVNDMLCCHNKKNQTPLLSAFDHSHWVAVDVLLEKCVKCNELPELTGVNAPAGLKSNTLLHRAFKRENTKYFDIFLRVCNANNKEGDQLTAAVLIPNKKNETPWYYAIHNLSSDKMFEKVLKMAKNKLLPLSFLYTDADSKSTMLHEAHRIGNNRRCQLLKDNGTEDTADSNGLFPIDRSRIIVQEDNMPNIEQEGPGEEGATNTTELEGPGEKGATNTTSDIELEGPGEEGATNTTSDIELKGPGEEGATNTTSDINHSSEINTEGGSTSGKEDMPQSESASSSVSSQSRSSSQSSYSGSVFYGKSEQCTSGGASETSVDH